MTPHRIAHLLVPEGYDDPRRASGGNVYDRQVQRGLVTLGWTVDVHPVPGVWPTPQPGIGAAVAEQLAGIPDHRVVVVDGLLGEVAAAELLRHARRLRLVALVHMPEEPGAPPGSVLRAARLVIATSRATGQALTARHDLHPSGLLVAPPGAAPAEAATGTPTGGALLCVGAVTEVKGHDVLFEALGQVSERTDRPWSCLCAGDLDREPVFADRQRRELDRRGLADRVRLAGGLAGAELERAYAAADLLVLASRRESYGMVVTEALARGLPVVATSVGGVPEALEPATGVGRPGLLVPADDPDSLAAAIASWLDDADLRERLRAAALDRRIGLADWPETVTAISAALSDLAAA